MTRTEVTELALLLCAYRPRQEDGWMVADEVRFGLTLLGVEARPQQVAAWLGKLARASEGYVEMRESPWMGGPQQYRMTAAGFHELHEYWALLRHPPWLPVYRRAPLEPRRANV